MKGHHEGICFKKHGYPPCYVPRRNPNNQIQAHNAVKTREEAYNEHSESQFQSSSSNFTQEQVNQLLQLIPRTSEAQSNMVGIITLLSNMNHRNTWILDTRATNHMTLTKLS